MIAHETIKFSIDDIDYEARVSIKYHVDNTYGADADGNRGEPRTFIDDIKIMGIIDNTGRLLDPHTISEKMVEKINALASEKI